VQALRPSYDNVRALMIAAASEGQFDKAMQLAERMNNLIPNGDKVRFGQTPDGQIIAQIQPEDGGPSTRHVLTPEQFARYANSPLSLFDHTAEQGLSQNFQMLTGQPGQPGSSASAAGTQLAQAGGAPAGAAAPPTGYNPQALGAQGGRILERAGVTDPGAGPIPRMGGGGVRTAETPEAVRAQATPARPAAPVAARPAAQPGVSPGTGLPRNALTPFEARRQPQTGYNNGQGGRPAAPRQESEEMRDWKISMQAWKAFPYDNQLTQRGQFEARLHMQNRREDFEREKRQFRPTGEQKLAQEGLKQQGLNYRADQVARTNEFKTKVTSDNAMVRAIMTRQTASERAAFTELVQRQRNWGQDLKNAGKPFPYTEQDLAIMKNAAGTALDNNLLDLRNYRPGSGVIRQDQPQAPQAPQDPQALRPPQTQQQAPQTQQRAPQAPQIAPSPTRTAPITKPTPGPKAPDLGTYRGDAPPPNWDIPPGWEWGRSKSTGIWEARPPRQGPAAAAPISH